MPAKIVEAESIIANRQRVTLADKSVVTGTRDGFRVRTLTNEGRKRQSFTINVTVEKNDYPDGFLIRRLVHPDIEEHLIPVR